MVCPLCRKRQARRACPALGRDICAVCCGTKRLVEIACPESCVYLASSKAHPPAVVRRQHERDVALLGPVLQGLTESQGQLFWLVLAQLTGGHNDPFLKLTDADVADGVAAAVATLETAERGVIYEHRPSSLAAQRVVTDFNAFFAQLAREAGRPVDRDAGVVLKRVQKLADAVRVANPGEPTVFLEQAARLVRIAASERGSGSAGRDAGPGDGPRIILP